MQHCNVNEGKVHQLLEALEVTLNIEFGLVQMNAQELLNLQNGQLVPIDFNPDQVVTLMLDKHEIARAKLRVGDSGLLLEIQEIIN